MINRMLLAQSVTRQQRIYERLFERHRVHFKSLHWSSTENQSIRFEQFLKAGDLTGKRVLDLGCGLGDFYGFLCDRGLEVNYTGYDIVPAFIKSARKRFPSTAFEERNILNRPPEERFDFVFASGLFAFGSRLFFQEMSRVADGLATEGWVFNLYQPRGDDTRFLNLSTQDAQRLCRRLGPARFETEQNYLHNDITFYLYKS